MKLINLADEREKRKEEGNPDLTMAQFATDAELTDLVMPSMEGQIAFLTDPEHMRGVLLTPKQAVEVALALIRSATLVESGALDALLQTGEEK